MFKYKKIKKIKKIRILLKKINFKKLQAIKK